MMSAIRTIVAGVSNPAHDDLVPLAAAEMARAAGAALHLVHAYELPHLHDLPHAGAFARYEAEAGQALAAAVDRRSGARPVCHVLHGSAARSILRVRDATCADVIVIGAAQTSRAGGTASRLLRESPVPVLVVRRPVPRPLERVLLATDLSPLSAEAHERGLDVIAALLGEPAAARSLLVVGAGTLPAPLPQSALDRTAHAELRRFLSRRRPRAAPVQAAVRTGAPAQEILGETRAWKADLLVVGTLGHVLLGSVADDVARDAPSNVLAIPASTAVPNAPDTVSEAA